MSGDLEAGLGTVRHTCVSAPQSSVHARHFCNFVNDHNPTFWELAMAGALRKTMVYLGLSEEDQRHDVLRRLRRYDEPDRYDDETPSSTPRP